MSRQAISGRELHQLDVAAQQVTAAPARELRSGTSIKPVAIEEGEQASTTSVTREFSSSVEIFPAFALFTKLPVAIRRYIWIISIPKRVVCLFYDSKNRKFGTHEPNISLLAVSKEAREAALQIVLPSFNTVGSSRIIYIDIEQDKIFLDPGRYGDLGHDLHQWHGALIPQHFRKIERLDIGLYEYRKDSAMNCIKALGETFLLDQARAGMPFTKVRLVAHTPFRCDLDRHTAHMFTVDCGDHVQIDWEQDLVAKVKEVNKSMLEIARYYWGSVMNDTYKKFAEEPVKLELHYVFCGMKGIEG